VTRGVKKPPGFGCRAVKPLQTAKVGCQAAKAVGSPDTPKPRMVEFRILGPLEVLEDGRPLALGGAKQRALLAILVLHRRERVSTDRLIDQLWGKRAPATAAKTVQVYVSHLRKAIGAKLLLTRGSGYLLHVEPEQVDADRFAALAAEGRQALADGDPSGAARKLREALAPWRGPPLADFAYEPFAQAEIARLDEERLAALEDRIDADLALGQHAALVSELEALIRKNPLRERLHHQLMLALYRSGRQADALERYRQARRTLNDELGLEPGPELQDLERRILAQDPDLAAPAQPSLGERLAGHGRVNRGLILLAAGGLVLAALAILVAVLSSGDSEGVDVAPNSVAVLDASDGHAIADIPVGTRPSAISAGEDAIWVANVGDGSVSQIRPRTRRVISTTAPGTPIDSVAAGRGAVWVTDTADAKVLRLDPEFRQVAARVRFDRPGGFGPYSSPVAVGSRSVWVGNANSARVVRIDPHANRAVARVDLGNEPSAIATAGSGVWVADDYDNTVSRIDPDSANAVTSTIPVGEAPSAIAVGEGGVWVANTQDGTVGRIDPDTGSVAATITVGGRPTGIAVGGGAVWVANSLDGSVSRIDPETTEVVETTELGQSPQSLVVADGSVWVTVQAKPPAVSRQVAAGGTLRVLGADIGSPDPAQYFGDSQRAYATCALLYNYPDQPVPKGSRMEPEVAKGPPAVSDGGRTYTFTLRRGFRFSPPSGERVTPASFKREIDRVLSPKLNAFPGSFMGDIVGAKAYMSGRAPHLAGVSASGNRLVVRLVRPAPDLPSRLATPWFCAVPSTTPFATSESTIIPSAGPYYTASYVPRRSMVLRRNPNYQGPRPSNLDEIDYESGASPADALADVEAGRADYYGGDIPLQEQARLDRRYGPHSPAARAGLQQYFVEPQLSVFSLLFNIHRPPFDDPRLRRAVNFALDRRALAPEPIAGETGRPADQYIPPGMPGFRDSPIYPLGGPDLERAKRLAHGVHAHVVLLTCNLPPCVRLGQIVRANLAPIGLDVEARGEPFARLFGQIDSPNPSFDLGQNGYFVDNPDPFDFINLQFQSGVALTHLFDDPVFNRRMAAAAQLTGARRYHAYARLDHDLATRAAPAAAYANGTTTNLFSSRIGCQVNQPIYGIDLGRLCVRR
jgi:YVTN family beta-propeller protein